MTSPDQATDARGPWWLTFRVLDEPAEVFRQLAARPRALAPLLLLAVVAAIVGFGTPESTLRNRAERQVQVAEERAPDQMTDERRQEILDGAASVRNRVIIFVAGSVVGIISLLIVAGVLQLVFGAVGSESLKFKDEFAITTHAYVPQLVGAVLLVILARFFGFDEMQLSLGFLFDEDAGFAYQLANQFTLFGAWNVLLLAVGNQIRTNMKTLGTPLAIVGGLWVLVNFGFAGLASVFAGFGG